jgi:hypothetical protein
MGLGNMGNMNWTRTARDLLFESLVDRFGPHAAWEKATSPGRGMDRKYNEFCEAFAALVGAKSGKRLSSKFTLESPGRVETNSVGTWDTRAAPS